MTHDMTTGSITGGLLRFALPLMLGNLLQQFYNIADTWVVGRFLGADAQLSMGYLLGHSGYLFIQLLCQFTPFCG